VPTQNSTNHRQALLTLVGNQHDLVISVKDTLRRDRQELLRLLSSLQTGWKDLKAARASRTTKLERENALLKKLVNSLQAANDKQTLRTEGAKGFLEIRALRSQLAEKEQIIQQLLDAGAAGLGASCEAELAAGHKDLCDRHSKLDSDRQLVAGEIEKAKNERAALREMASRAELELARERAQLARERMEINRTREEVRHEVERAVRCAEVEELLAPVQRLQEELNDRHRQVDVSTNTPPPPRTKALGSRWRALLAKLDDARS
jgi:hypothetical protein